MQNFQIDGGANRKYCIQLEEALAISPELIHTLVDIDLQTFSVPTFSEYTAAAFLKNGRVFLLKADDIVIGTCVCIRCWERPNEMMVLSMGIRPGWRGRGLGQEFIGRVLGRLHQKGCHSVSLMVGSDNKRAIKVYTDVGFEVVEEEYTDPHTSEVLLHMRKKLRGEGVLITLP